VGAIRGAGRFEYVAVGNVVNLAARLCDRAEDGEILADKRTIDALIIDDPVLVEERDPERLKGFEEPVPVAALWIDPERAKELAPLPPPKRRDRRRRKKRRRH
jgi:class 3 adenylate cyclase